MAYRIQYSAEALGHLRTLTARQRSTVLDAVEEQLPHEPSVETRNRKRLRPNPVAPWELRVGELRVYYEVEDDPETVVSIVAVGIKSRSRVRIGKREVDL